ncbi:hypothetical protein [Stenotrophomonas sp. PS02289]|uniref:hypothetical protein n=1 Tax=Stenotrophomonas sp. PS02289 TaxID=2991422 RepID=UPI00249BAF93|nr:hypothetical protein [Stenotrophomonas sp. PS02289]
MKRPVMFKFRMEDEMRCRLKDIARRTGCPSPDLVRLLVDRLIAYDYNPHVVDLTVWSNMIDKAAVATGEIVDLSADPPAYGEEDEVDRARREGWASPKFGRR